MKGTAILHAAFAVLLVAGFLVSEQALRFGLFGLAAVCFVAGIALARRGSDEPEPVDGA